MMDNIIVIDMSKFRQMLDEYDYNTNTLTQSGFKKKFACGFKFQSTIPVTVKLVFDTTQDAIIFSMRNL